MDWQTTILIGFAALFAAALVVSLGGWVLFARERRARRGAPRRREAPPPEEPVARKARSPFWEA